MAGSCTMRPMVPHTTSEYKGGLRETLGLVRAELDQAVETRPSRDDIEVDHHVRSSGGSAR